MSYKQDRTDILQGQAPFRKERNCCPLDLLSMFDNLQKIVFIDMLKKNIFNTFNILFFWMASLSSAKQMIENNITLFGAPSGDYWVEFLATSPIPEYRTLSKSMVIAKDWDEYNQLTEYGILGNGTHVKMSFALEPWEKSLGRWWQGNLVLGDCPYAGYFADKKWHLNEANVIFNLALT